MCASDSWMVQNLATLGSFLLSSPPPLLWSLELAYEMESVAEEEEGFTA